MYRLFNALLILILLTSPFAALAAPPDASGDNDWKGVCELAGGSFTGQGVRSWACTWQDWGCYSCRNGICKMECRSKRCRDANHMSEAVPALSAKSLGLSRKPAKVWSTSHPPVKGRASPRKQEKRFTASRKEGKGLASLRKPAKRLVFSHPKVKSMKASRKHKKALAASRLHAKAFRASHKEAKLFSASHLYTKAFLSPHKHIKVLAIAHHRAKHLASSHSYVHIVPKK